MASTADEDADLREMAPWMEEWSMAARVIGEEEEEGISLSHYEDKYRTLLRDIATLTKHVASLRAKRDSAIEERDSIAKDLEHLRQNFDRMVAEHDSLRDKMERNLFHFILLFQQNSTRDECQELKENVKGLMDRCGRLVGLLLATGGNPSLVDVNPYVRVPLPSSVWSQSQSRTSTQMTRGPR
ncbi:hypothetical protein AMTR_s00014p00219340 [Amborella trichopoda]|uniref:Uncharacterized protein n=1 Tax=Amborella trichopoda TaxID=13333 RepID=W1PMZ1_AMBTC|nr:hypothetical protein AMTR_s00014p00219340 [Amborella trichopoda]